MTYPDAPIHPTNDFPEDSDKPYGLTKREYFAALAMQAYVSMKPKMREQYPNNTPEEFDAVVAEAAVLQADALIAALNNQS